MANYSETDVAMAKVLADFVAELYSRNGYGKRFAIEAFKRLCVEFCVYDPRFSGNLSPRGTEPSHWTIEEAIRSGEGQP